LMTSFFTTSRMAWVSLLWWSTMGLHWSSIGIRWVQKAGLIPLRSLIEYQITFLCFFNKKQLLIFFGTQLVAHNDWISLVWPKNSYFNPLGKGLRSTSGTCGSSGLISHMSSNFSSSTLPSCGSEPFVASSSSSSCWSLIWFSIALCSRSLRVSTKQRLSTSSTSSSRGKGVGV
jgi:hypothetical protein